MKKKISIVPNEAIRKHLANNSTAKVTHAFPKATRFSPPNPEYFFLYLGANKHSMAALPLYLKEKVELASERGLISPAIQSSHQVRQHTSIEVSSIN